MRIFRRIGFLFALLAGGAALSGCGGDSTIGPRSEKPFTAVSDKAFVVSGVGGLSLVADADSVLVFDVTGAVPEIRPGNIIVGTQGDGYIRSVQSVRLDGGRLYVEANPAGLADAIIAGGLDTTIALGFGSSARGAAASVEGKNGGLVEAARGVSVVEDGLSLSDVELFAGDVGGSALTVRIANGRIEFNPTIDLRARISLGRIYEVRVDAEGALALACDVWVEASGRVDVDRTAPIATVRKTLIQHIGSVPVVEVVTMSFVAGFHLISDSMATAAVGIETSGHARCSMRYEHRAWSRTLTAEPEFQSHPFNYYSGEESRFELSIEPRITVEFYGLPSVELAFGPSFGFSETDGGFPVLEWELFAAVGGRTSFEPGALDVRMREYHASARCCETTLDSGPFRTDHYIFIRQWGNEAIGWDGNLFYPKGIAVDQAGDLYVADNWANVVLKFTPDGEVLLFWGGTGAGDGQFDAPEKIAVDEDGYVYVADSGNNRVQKFTSEGVFVAKWGSEGTGDGEFRSPVGVAASGGFVYVTDSQNERVQRFSANGDFLGAWGAYGTGPAEFDGPAGIAVVPGDGSILVADCHNDRVQRFSPGGEYLGLWGGLDDQLDCAIDVTVAMDGSVFVADLGNDRFIRFAPDGSFVTKLGTRGIAPGEFDHPEAVAVDAHGNVYVVDSRNRRIQKFAPRIVLRSSSGVVTGLSPN